MRRRARALAFSLCCAIGGMACADAGEQGEVWRPSGADAPGARAPDYESASELVRAIGDGTFTGGLAEAEAAGPAVPAPLVVPFVSGTEPPADQLPALEALAEAVAAEPRLQVRIVGCSDPEGPDDANQKLSQARAESIAALLQGSGVGSDQIAEVVGRGEGCEVQERVVHVTPSARDASG